MIRIGKYKMNGIDITEYKTAKGEYAAYIGKATLKKGYAIADGDETFYHFVGKNSCFPLTELLHPDDVEGFIEATEALGDSDNQKQDRKCIIVRMRGADDIYKIFYMELWRNGVIDKDFYSISFEFCSFMDLRERYVTYTGIVKKYRAFMNLSQNMFFEYSFDSDELKIYRYVNGKSQPVLNRTLDEIYKEIMSSKEYSGKSKNEFGILYDFLKKGVDRFSASFDAQLLIAETKGRLMFKSSTMYEQGARTMAIGIVDLTESESTPKSYYMTENAFDAGTGLWNKRAINEYAVEKTLENKPLYLCIMDVDDFKKINDTYGHMFGDVVLSKVAEIIRSVVDTRGVVGRFGGDEFMIVLDSVMNEEDLRRILKTISKNMSWAYMDLKDSITVTNSCGVAKFPDDGATFEELFLKADKALYIAKEKGKNRFIIYDEVKHGSLVNEGESVCNVGIKAIASDSKKAAVMSEVVLSLHNRGTGALAEAMEKLRNYFDIDGITIYCGSDMHRALTAGKYINPIEQLTFAATSSYLALFDERGVFGETHIRKLCNAQPEAYKLYEQQENQEFVQFAAYRNKKLMAVVAFDYFNRAPKIGAADLGLMTIVGRLMAEVSCGLG